LYRLLQSQGFGSRKACRELVAAGRVSVNGVPGDDPDREFESDGLVLGVDGEAWPYRG
jgi:16S rRNA pseudouridine516 synthase